MPPLTTSDRAVSPILSVLVENDCVGLFAVLLSKMKSFEQRKYFDASIVFIVREYFTSDTLIKVDAPIASSDKISCCTALIYCFTKDNDILKEHLVSALTRSSIPSLDDSLAARRCVVSALARDEGESHIPFFI